ncbi:MULTISPECIES: ABC transporter permease subunit [unclassified Archaeoglobus]|jgi:branched-subunit amino acid ABC-type transport system permease component|uniref:ABC transporter permease subunit n=1 Tax=unclassified Archaeoglobus TaxID=2643606 RepID=UPI0025BFF476|nr:MULTISPECIES: hypothetical protein [unclassified Archaeoglobus]
MISALLTAIFLSFFASVVILNYKIGRVLNLSFASIFTLGAYLYFSFSPLSALLLALISGGIMGAIVSAATRKLSVAEATIVSLGFAIAIEEFLRLFYRTSYYQVMETSYVELLGEAVSIHEVLNGAMLAMLFLTFAAILLSRRGFELKFVEDDWELAEMYGIDTSKIRYLTISISSSFICLSGAVLAPTQSLSPSMGWNSMVTAVIIAAIAASAGNVGLRKYVLTLPIALAYTAILRWLP